MMIWTLLLAALAAAPAVDFEAQTLDGRSAVGRLEKLDSKELLLATDGGPQAFALSALAALAPRASTRPEPAPRAPIWIELVDQTTLAVGSYAVKNGRARIGLGSIDVEVPTKLIAWVRFSDPAAGDEKVAAQWADVLAVKAAGDLLVVRKNAAIDYHEGVVGDLDEESCKFELDKEPIAVKRAKIEGIVYFHASAPKLPEAVGIAETRGGSRLSLAAVSLAGGRLETITTAGIKLSLPLEDVARFDFTSGKIAYLSDLSPEAFKYTPYFGFKDQPAAVGEYYEYRRDSGFDLQPLKIDGKSYRKGLALASRSLLAYRLPGKFRQFKTVIGIDDSAGDSGDVRVEFRGDGKQLWQGDVRAADAARELEIDVTGVKRLEIVVDYGGDLDIGDRLDLAEARVTK